MTIHGVDWWTSRFATPVAEKPGESGYFSPPTSTLDPRLFSGDKIRPQVRAWILMTVYDYWASKYHSPKDWSTLWLAGSGISYQWSAARGNGDLDVLAGVNWSEFFRVNDGYQGFSEDEMADLINADLHANLWPKIATTEINDNGAPIPGGIGANIFEVTVYVNPHSTDIRDINPYAAYNLTTDSWTVRPPNVPQKPGSAFPQAFWDTFHEEKSQAHALIIRYNAVATDLKSIPMNTPSWHNAVRHLQLLTSQAKGMFDDIHLGRKQAFGPGGSGYGDFYNFRWQAHKKAGTVQALDALAKAQQTAKESADTELYGGPIDGAETALRRAVMQHRSLV